MCIIIYEYTHIYIDNNNVLIITKPSNEHLMTVCPVHRATH